MIIYDPTQKVSLAEFGIKIPVHDSRAVKTFAELMNHPTIGARMAHWHQSHFTQNITKTDLKRVHSTAYIDRLYSDKLQAEIIRTYELMDASGQYHRFNPQEAEIPLTDLFKRILMRVAGTYHCCRWALTTGFAFYFGGGMHHAQSGHGRGFCLLNDIVIAVRKLQFEGFVKSAWIIDVDAHKGDGTAALTRDDATIVTLSIHMAQGWPLDDDPNDLPEYKIQSLIPSDVDIPVKPDENGQYNDKLLQGLHALTRHDRPDIAVVVCGADPYVKDELPSTKDLQLSLEQLLERDQLVYRFLQDRHIPKAYLMAGGYGRQSWQVYTQFLTWALLDHYDGGNTTGQDPTPEQTHDR